MDSINLTELKTKSGILNFELPTSRAFFASQTFRYPCGLYCVEHKTGEFLPKPKMQMHKEIHEASESTSFSLGPQSVLPEIGYAEQDSIPSFQQDDVLDLSSLGFTNTLPAEATSGLHLNEESMNPMEMSQLDSDINLEGLQEIPAKLVSYLCIELICIHIFLK